VFLFPLVFQSL